MDARSPRSSRTRRFWKALLALSIGFALVLPLLEIGIRFLVLGDSELARRLGESLRKPEYFADSNVDDDYWKLQYLFLPDDKKGPAKNADAVCGWTGDYVTPGTYEHARASDVGGRRPVLLYGDSYAACATEAQACFQGILERSDLAGEYALVNYGVGGYGVDQVCLLLRKTIDAWKDRDPIVVISFLVDNDFDRDILSFRCWPKPRFAIEDGELVASGPLVTDPERYLEENPPSIRSYLLRYLTYRKGMLPSRWQWYLRRGSLKNEEKIALGRKILEEIHSELETRGIEHFFLSFHGEAGVARSDGVRWADELVGRAAADLGVPLVETRPYLLAAANGSLEQANRYFGGAPRLFGHYNEMGNLIAFEALRAGLERRFGEVDPRAIATALAASPLLESPGDVLATVLGRPARIRTRGTSGLARASHVSYPPFDPAANSLYLLLRPGEEGPTELTIDVEGEPRNFRGRAIGVARRGEDESPEPLILTVRLDGTGILRTEVPYHPDGIDLDIPLAGARRFEIVVDRRVRGGGESWIHVADARLQSPP
ncbi:MAG: hypothetical protein ACKVXR_09535 [Planctomycetota bacterium]